MIAEVKAATSKRPDGSWAVRLAGGSYHPTAERFRTRKVGCSSFDKCGCKWVAEFEDTSGGWVLTRYKPHDGPDAKDNGHNHDLDQSAAEVMAARSGEYIPPLLMDLADKMATGRNSASVIHATLKDNASKMGLPVTWRRDTIYDWYVRNRMSDEFDLTELVELLKKREQIDGYSYKTSLEACVGNAFILRRVKLQPSPLHVHAVTVCMHACRCSSSSSMASQSGLVTKG